MPNEIIDVHIHCGAPKDDISGCFWSGQSTETMA